MAYAYTVTAQKPTSVSRSITGNFTSPNEVNLIISKVTRLEIHTLTPEGLQPFLDIGMYGRIATMKLFRPPNEKQDLLFISTERHKFCVLAYDSESGEIITKANGDIIDATGKPIEHAQIGIIDPKSRVIVLHMYIGWIKVIHIDKNGHLDDAYNLRIEELQVLDMQFLYNTNRPTLMILHQDGREDRHISVYELVLEDRDLIKISWPYSNVESASSIIIPVPSPFGGALIVGEMTISYVNGKKNLSIEMNPSNMMAYGQVDPNGSRFLLGDLKGNLFVLVLRHDNKSVLELNLEQLGSVSIPSTITYLDNGVVFIGSTFGDSQLVRLKSEKDPETNCYLEYLDSFTNLGPILDFIVVDLERQGQGQVVTCSGAFKDGSIRIIRNGIGINEQATIELPGVKGVWSLKGSNSMYDKYLVVSFVKQTRILAITEEEMDEVEIPGIDSGSQTLHCSTLIDNRFLQITEKQVRIISADTLQLIHCWNTEGSDFINVASSNGSQAVFSVGGGKLVYLDLSGENIIEVGSVVMEHEISCLNINSLGNKSRSDFCAVGLWTDISVRILKLPSLEEVAKEVLGGEFIPRSVLFVTFEESDYLMCSLGDGHFFSFKFTPDTFALHDKKKISLGTQPILLNTFESKNSLNVFAASDRPTVIFSNSRKLLFSNVNLKEVDYMCSFNTEAFPDSLAIAADGNLMIGTIDDIQKLHIRTIPLGEMPRRIAHHNSSSTFGLIAINFGINDSGNDTETSYLRILDDQTFEVQDSFQFKDSEQGWSIASVTFSSDPKEYLVVGTTISRPNESQPQDGRILVFTIQDSKKIQLVCEQSVSGAAFCLSQLMGKLLVGVNSSAILYSWNSSCELETESTFEGNILLTNMATKNSSACLVDLMRSICVINYNSMENSLEESARDYVPRWATAAEFLVDDAFIGAENSFNLYTVYKNPEAESVEDQTRLEIFGKYHLGEFINKFRNASLVMKPPEGERNPTLSTTLYGTVLGAIGVVASISKEDFEFFERVQAGINEVIKGVGGLSHSEWRSFCANNQTFPACWFIDGDLVESFLDLKPEKMAQVAISVGVSVQDLCKKIEELAQALH